jgi:ferritin
VRQETLQQTMNEQIKNELYSAYFYLSVAGHFEAMHLPGFAHWMKVQSQEEVNHAMKFFNFLLQHDSRITLLPLDQPPCDFQSPLDAFSQALENEKRVTSQIHHLHALALQEQNANAQVLLQWFIEEQVEEEESVSEVIEDLKRVGEDADALLRLSKTLGTRHAEENLLVGESTPTI